MFRCAAPTLWCQACAQGPGTNLGPHGKQSDPGPATWLSSGSHRGGQHLRAQESCELSARRCWHQAVTVVGCVKKGADRQLLAAQPAVAQHRGQGGEPAGPSPTTASCYSCVWTLLEDCSCVSQDSPCLPPKVSGAQQGPLSPLDAHLKGNSPPPQAVLAPGGNSQCPVVLGTSCECAVSRAAAQEEGKSQWGAGARHQQLEGELRRAERSDGKAQ